MRSSLIFYEKIQLMVSSAHASASVTSRLVAKTRAAMNSMLQPHKIRIALESAAFLTLLLLIALLFYFTD
jgi:hypothetical protein